jgi:FkbM family methyltransferase
MVKKVARTCVSRGVRNWLRSPSRSGAWAYDELRYATGLRQTVEVRPGWSLRCHPAAYRFAYYAQKQDLDQVAEFDGFIASCHRGMVLFDLGAHFGIFSLAALHYGGMTARALAVDPSPLAVRMMKIQSELNDVGDRLQILQASVGCKQGWQEMVSTGVTAAGYYVAPTSEHTGRELTQTRAVTLDQLVQEYGTLPTLLKIDVEGYEAAVLEGGQYILSRADAPALFLELHNQIVRERHGDPSEALSLLRKSGYRLFTVDGRSTDEGRVVNAPIIRIIAKKAGEVRT